MRIRRSLPIVLAVVAIAAAITLVVQLRKHAPPEPARLLPSADAFLYMNLKWARTVNAVGQMPAVSHDPEYEQFIQETGFQFERDLDEAAFAVHYPPSGATREKDGSPPPPRFTEVFRGKIEGERLRAYLRKISQSVDSYGSTDIFNIPLEGRTVRVAILGVDSVAVSNHDDPQVIRGIVDRSRKLASPFAGPATLRQYYKRVPLASLAWAIVRVEPGREAFAAASLGSLNLIFSKPATVVISARFIRALHLRAEAFTDSADDARNITEKLGTFLSIFQAAEVSVAPQGADLDVKALFDSLKVEQQRDRAVLTAVVPPGFLRKAFQEPPSGPSSTMPQPDQKPPAGPAAKAPKASNAPK